MDEGCTQPLSSDPMINMNTTVFSFLILFSRSRGISTTWSLSPLQLMITKKHGSKGWKSNTHKTQNKSTITHTGHNLSSKHNSRSSLFNWSSSHYLKESNAREWSLGVLECFLKSLDSSSMRLGVPFIAPRQLGAVGSQQGRLILSSVGWRTGQSGAPPDSHCSCLVRDSLPNLAQPTVADLWQLAHRTLSGAHRTVRCPLPTVGAGHASPADLAANRCAGGRWLTGQFGAPPDSPVNYSRTSPKFSRE
jgi:hypothetical protein